MIFQLYRDGVLIYEGAETTFVDTPLKDDVHHQYTVRSWRINPDTGLREESALVGPVEGCTAPPPPPRTRVHFQRLV